MRGSAVSLRLGYLMQCGMKVVKGSQDRYKIKKGGFCHPSMGFNKYTITEMCLVTLKPQVQFKDIKGLMGSGSQLTAVGDNVQVPDLKADCTAAR